VKISYRPMPCNPSVTYPLCGGVTDRLLDLCQVSSLPHYCGFKEKEIPRIYMDGHLLKLKCKYSNIYIFINIINKIYFTFQNGSIESIIVTKIYLNEKQLNHTESESNWENDSDCFLTSVYSLKFFSFWFI